MELERMHGGGSTRARHSRRANANESNESNDSNDSNDMGSRQPMEHLNLSLPLHVQVPPLPSPNTTAAAAALFRVNQLPPAASPTVSSSSTAGGGVFSFAKSSKRQRGAAPHDALSLSLSLPTPTTAAAAAAAMALSASSPASAASAASVAMDQHNKTHASHSTNHSSHSGGGGGGGGGGRVYAMAVSPDAASGGEREASRRRKVGIPKFLRFLFQMLEYEDQEIIAWSHDGTAFQIRDPEELAERVLPKYFKHNKVSSFQRQLNYFGFKKWTKTQTNICTFSHPCFVRSEQENMRLIKRKERSTRATGTSAGGGGSVAGVGGGAVKQEEGMEEEDADGEDQDEPEGETLSDGEDDSRSQQQRPAKRAKLQPRPVSAARARGAAGTTNAAAGSKQESRAKAVSSKPSRAKKSPRAARGSAREDEKELDAQEDEGARARGGRTMQLPTISPASSASTLTGTSFSRMVSHSGDESPPPQASSVYNRGDGGGGGEDDGEDAVPVMPIHAEMMMQQNALYGRRLQSGDANNSTGSGSLYDSGSGMQDLSESFGVGQNAWQSTYGLSSFKFSDPSALESSFDMGNSAGGGGSGGGSSGSYGSGPQGMGNTKDYLDVLLESANMDDQISAQSSVGSSDSGMSSIAAWEATYRSNQQQQQQLQLPHQLYGHQGREQTHANDRRMGVEAAMATYNMLSGGQSHGGDGNQMSMQLPSIEDLQGMRY